MPHVVAIEGFGSDPERYERGRPGYPVSAVQAVLDALGDVAGAVIADIGAGTGKLTRELVASGSTVVAVDPVPAMTDVIIKQGIKAHVVTGAAETLPFADNSLAGLTVAQAFHWFEGDKAWDEFARVLRPGSAAVFTWNARIRTNTWVEEIWKLLDGVEKHAPWSNRDQPSRFPEHAHFAEMTKQHFEHRVPMTEAAVFDRLTSVSHVAILPEDEQQRLIAQTRQIIRSSKGPLEFPYRTDVYVRTRL